MRKNYLVMSVSATRTFGGQFGTLSRFELFDYSLNNVSRCQMYFHAACAKFQEGASSHSFADNGFDRFSSKGYQWLALAVFVVLVLIGDCLDLARICINESKKRRTAKMA